MEWKTFRHNGVLFYPEYIPHNIKLIYNKKSILVDSITEEYLTYFVKIKGYLRDEIFQNNFLNSLNSLTHNKYRFRDVRKFNFKNYIKLLPHINTVSESQTQPYDIEDYKYVIIDGIQHKLGNPMVEPPGIFIGRGDHPLRGTIKQRIYPEDVIINIDNNANTPPCILNGHHWRNIVHDNRSTWIASWKDSITDNYKYINLASISSIKMEREIEKYDKSRKLKMNIIKIRKRNNKNMNSEKYKYRQLSTVIYLIDKLCLRIGNEKDDNTADTVGATSLKVGNITLLGDNELHIHFLGKDSILFDKIFKVDSVCYHNISLFIKNKNLEDLIFDKINSISVNRYLDNFMEGLTAKVFRTFRSSELFYKKLLGNHIYNKKGDIHFYIQYYKSINLIVAQLCNHRKNRNLELSLETSKKNYLDPRITFAYSKKYNIPIHKLFSKGLIERHKWAEDTPIDFKY